jgi:hypothetical protein
MEDPTLGSWYVCNKVLSHMSVVVTRNPRMQPRFVSCCGWLNWGFFGAASLHCNPKCCFGKLQISHRCNALIEHLSAVVFVEHCLC